MVITRARKQKGSSLVEFALGFTVLWMLFSGIYQFGYATFRYNILATSVRGAARFAARTDFDDPDHNFVQLVRNVAVYGTPYPADADEPMLPDLNTDNVAVTWSRDANGVPRTVTVAVRNYNLLSFVQQFTLNDHPSVTVKHAGLWRTPPGGQWED